MGETTTRSPTVSGPAGLEGAVRALSGLGLAGDFEAFFLVLLAFGFRTASMAAFCAAPTGFVRVYAARLSFFTAFGVTAFFAVPTGCMALWTDLGVALRTLFLTRRLANPTTVSFKWILSGR